MRLTVVVPAWNHGLYLGACLSSVLAQTLRPERVVVVDDASTDDTPGVVGAFDGVEYRRLPERVGTAAALLYGFALATTEWIMAMGADDTLPPDYVAAHAAHLERLRLVEVGHRPVGVLYSRADYVDDDGRVLGNVGARPWAPGSLRCGNFVHGGALVLRQAYERAGGMPLASQCEDWQLWLRIEELGYDFAYVPTTAYGYRQHGAGHRNYGTDSARDGDWGGRRVQVKETSNPLLARLVR